MRETVLGRVPCYTGASTPLMAPENRRSRWKIVRQHHAEGDLARRKGAPERERGTIRPASVQCSHDPIKAVG